MVRRSDPTNSTPRRKAPQANAQVTGRPPQDRPAWAEGIRELYDAVTREPLPTDFQKLLDQLGKASKN